MTPTVLRVFHRGEPKIVGKVFEVPMDDGQIAIFLHEESGTQTMHKFGGPGIDAIVVAWCLGNWVMEYHHRTWGKPGLRFMNMDVVPRVGIRKSFDRRDRFIVPWEHFVEAQRQHYHVPWATKELVLEPTQVDWSLLHVEPEPSPEQLSLLDT